MQYPLATLISIQQATKMHQQPLKDIFRQKIYSNFMNTSHEKKEDKNVSEETEYQKKNCLTC